MTSLSVSVYACSLVLLFLKFFVTISIQARERLRYRHFRYAEDAKFWRGQVASDSELCQRAQNLLRNDAESQPFYVAMGGLYLLTEAWTQGGPFYFAIYATSRVLHAYFFLKGYQPHRNRAFSFGIAVLFILCSHVVARVIHPIPRGEQSVTDIVAIDSHQNSAVVNTQAPSKRMDPS